MIVQPISIVYPSFHFTNTAKRRRKCCKCTKNLKNSHRNGIPITGDSLSLPVSLLFSFPLLLFHLSIPPPLLPSSCVLRSPRPLHTGDGNGSSSLDRKAISEQPQERLDDSAVTLPVGLHDPAGKALRNVDGSRLKHVGPETGVA